MKGVYYNEIAAYPAQWLRNMVKAGHLPEGDVDERDIKFSNQVLLVCNSSNQEERGMSGIKSKPFAAIYNSFVNAILPCVQTQAYARHLKLVPRRTPRNVLGLLDLNDRIGHYFHEAISSPWFSPDRQPQLEDVFYGTKQWTLYGFFYGIQQSKAIYCVVRNLLENVFRKFCNHVHQKLYQTGVFSDKQPCTAQNKIFYGYGNRVDFSRSLRTHVSWKESATYSVVLQ